VAASIREFGFRQPIVVDEACIIVAGHTRYAAALKLGLAEVPVRVARGLSPEQVRAYRLADNATRDLSEWNYELLPIELGALKTAGYDLGLIGFPEHQLTLIMEGAQLEAGLTDPDNVPEPPDAATTQPGDLWLLGDHRLLCGDAGKEDDVDRLLDGAAIQLVNTDPPYNARVEPLCTAGRKS
jgi:ParB-like chromosome segregation protein Spo0J